MLYLAGAIIFGSLFSIIFKLCQNFKIDTRKVILFNYITAAIATWIPIGLRLIGGKSGVTDFSLPAASCGFALFQGFMFVLGFSIMDRSIWRSGVALTTVSARASLILPVIFGWLLLSQPAPAWLPVGIVLVALALIVLPAENESHDRALLSDKTDARRRRLTELALVVVFLCYGVSDFCLKLAQHSVEANLPEGAALDSHLDSLMGLIFLSASVFSAVICLLPGPQDRLKSIKQENVERHRLSGTVRSIVGGVALGAANLLCTSCSLRALSILPTGTYYPIYNIGIVIVATVAGVLCFKEKIKWPQVVGIVLSILAIFLFFR